MRRKALLLATAATLLLTGCSGDTGASEPEREIAAASTSSTTAASPSAEAGALASVCADHCQLLLDAQDADCPEPSTNVSLCVPYLTELTEAVYDVRDALDQTSYASRDHPDLLAAVSSHTEAVETFAAERCYEVTAASVNSDFACGMQPLTIMWSAATVGLRLQAAAGQ